MTSKFTQIQKKRLPPSKLAWDPRPYQKRAIKLMLQNACHGLLVDPGLGKTSIMLAVVKILKKEKIPAKTLIVAPLRVCYLVWPAEQEKWEDFKGLKVAILHGRYKEKLLNEDADIYMINPEGLPWLYSKNLKKLGFNILGVDESTKFKSTNTKRFKELKPFLPHFDRRYIFTGSPMPKNFMDLFGQIYILDLGAALGPYITKYRSDYFYPTGFGGYGWKLQDGADKVIQKKIKPLVLRLEDKDYLELPEIVNNKIYIELPEEARKIYEQMEDDFITRIGTGAVAASSAAVAGGKCRQIANGGLYGEFKEVFEIHDLKAQAVADRIEEAGGSPVLVAYEFGHDLQRLLKVLGKDTPYIGGGVSPKRSKVIEEAWNAGELPYLLGQPSAMGHGLNLQRAGNRIIHHSLIWNWEDYYQFNRRVRRQGNTHSHVYIDHVLAKNTLDEAVYNSYDRKATTEADFLEGFKDYAAQKKDSQKVILGVYKSKKEGDSEKELSTLASVPGGSRKSKESKMSKDEKPSKFTAKKAVTVDVKNKKIVDGDPTAKTSKVAAKKTAAPAKKAAAPAKKAATKTKAVDEGAGRTSPYAGKKIKVLNKEHGMREGSIRALLMTELFKSKTTDEALTKSVNVKGKDYPLEAWVFRIAANEGLIEIAA